MNHLYIGNGKGKTSAAIGLAMRQLGNNKSVLFISFLKGNESSEFIALRQFPNFKQLSNKSSNKFLSSMNKEEQRLTKNEQEALFNEVKLIMNNYDCVILDEVMDLLPLHVIESEQLTKLIKNFQGELVLTGHHLDSNLMKLCDYFTEFKCVKHPYEKGVKARLGVEY